MARGPGVALAGVGEDGAKFKRRLASSDVGCVTKQLIGLLQVVAVVVRRRRVVDVELVARLVGADRRTVLEAIGTLIARGFLDPSGRVTARGASLIGRLRTQGAVGRVFVPVGRGVEAA